MLSKKVLNVENISFKYKDIDILKDISFFLESGDFVGVLGPNGCGKSTLLKNINRWLQPYKGKVYINDLDVSKTDVKNLAKRVATVSQDIYFDISFTARQIVSMGRNPYIKNLQSESKKDLSIIKQSMDAMDIWHLKDKPFYQLSGGEKQRVLIARAIAQQPDLLLLDEPTSHLDINYQWELLDLLKKLCVNNSLTILVVLHDINLASMFCNKVILLKEHKIFKMGYLDEVLNEQSIKDVFNMDVNISFPEGSHKPVVIFLNPSERDNLPKPFKSLHVICGGGEGENLLYYLGRRGYKVSTGVLNKGDTDWKIAKLLGFTIIEEIPFSPISEEKMNENISNIRKSDAIILANIPFGFGNLRNLACLKELVSEKIIYILEEQSIEQRDYTNGDASKLYTEIKKGATVLSSMEELKKII